jgi:hypothetical protein
MVVLAVGTSDASTGSIPFGGHSDPISIVGANEEWKYAQNILKKKNTSLTMNKTTPNEIPF